MDEVVVRPFWDAPPSIARKELLPLIRREPGYFASERFEIVRGGDEATAPFPPTSRNLESVASGSHRLRQRPGTLDALGPGRVGPRGNRRGDARGPQIHIPIADPIAVFIVYATALARALARRPAGR